MFSAQHYREIATLLRMSKLRAKTEADRLYWAAICRQFMAMFAKDNPKFDRKKFINYIILGKEKQDV